MDERALAVIKMLQWRVCLRRAEHYFYSASGACESQMRNEACNTGQDDLSFVCGEGIHHRPEVVRGKWDLNMNQGSNPRQRKWLNESFIVSIIMEC